jgi:hypothetical protein
MKPKLTRGRMIAALVVGGLADLIQLPITASLATGVLSIPAEVLDVTIDLLVMAITTALLGFHFVLLPTFALELVPGVGALPTWTGCVSFVLWQRKREQTAALAEAPKALDNVSS